MALKGPKAEKGRSPSHIFAERVRRIRAERGWSQEQLANRLADLGHPIHSTAINKIERRTRGLSLDDAIAIAVALDTPLPLLFLPLGEADGVALTPEHRVHPDMALQWLQCESPMTGTDVAWWTRQVAPADRYRELRTATQQLRESASALTTAEYLEDPEKVKRAREQRLKALRAFAEVLDEMESDGVRPPAVAKSINDEMVQLGLRQRRSR